MQEKERRLEEQNRNQRKEQSKVAQKHEDDLNKVRAQEMTKMIMASSVCFLVGVAVAMFLFGGANSEGGAIAP